MGGLGFVSSVIGNGKISLLHNNKAHGEALKNITEVPMAQKSDREVTHGVLLFSG